MVGCSSCCQIVSRIESTANFTAFDFTMEGNLGMTQQNMVLFMIALRITSNDVPCWADKPPTTTSQCGRYNSIHCLVFSFHAEDLSITRTLWPYTQSNAALPLKAVTPTSPLQLGSLVHKAVMMGAPRSQSVDLSLISSAVCIEPIRPSHGLSPASLFPPTS